MWKVSKFSLLTAKLRVIVRSRFFASFFLIACLKLLAALWVYGLLAALTSGYPTWFLLFHGWDSVFYFTIASSGYASKSYAFFPAFPSLIRALSYVVKDPREAAALLSIIIGMAWIPIFHRLAEQYLPRRDAFEATVLAAAFPYVFLFTTLAYSEGLFTLATVSAWYFHLREKYAAAGLSATIAALTRAPGILILLPMLVNVRRIGKKLSVKVDLHKSYYFVPIAALAIWVSYVQLVTGSWLTIPESSFGFWGNPSSNTLGPSLLQLFGTTPHPTLLPAGELRPISIIAFVALATLFVAKTSSTDRRLGVYSWSLLLFFFVAGYIFSLLRFVSFIFPAWLAMRSGSRIGLVMLTALFLVVSVFLWFLFLTGFFVG